MPTSIIPGAIVHRRGGTQQFRVLGVRPRLGTHESEAVLEPVGESWVKRISELAANLEIAAD